MVQESFGVSFDGNIDGLLSALKAAKSAIDDAFNLDKVAEAQRKLPVGQLFQTMERSSDQAINSMIRGTETWQAALMNIATSLEVRFAQLASHRLITWMESELGMTAASNQGAALRSASAQEESDASLASKAQSAISSILNDSKEVFGGIFAFLAPEMGPAAAGPAAAGSATVAALASDIVYAETGAWQIPSNTLAYLHAGEMVVPQPFADSLRNSSGFGGGGGDSYAITINAIDTQTGAQFLKDNAGAIASALSGQARNFNRNVPTWKG